MNVESLLDNAFSNFENDKTEQYDIWRIKIHILQFKKVG